MNHQKQIDENVNHRETLRTAGKLGLGSIIETSPRIKPRIAKNQRYLDILRVDKNAPTHRVDHLRPVPHAPYIN
jgi:hypothetical protein